MDQRPNKGKLVIFTPEFPFNKQRPKWAVFLQNDEAIQLTVPQAIRSPTVQAEYKAWLAGVTERINGVHHQRHKSKFTQATDKSSMIYPFSVQSITKINNKHACVLTRGQKTTGLQ